MVDLNILVGGSAGQGIQTIGNILAKSFSLGGYNVFTSQHYYSRVRGGHNTYSVRISDHPVHAIKEGVNLLIALDSASLKENRQELVNGLVLLDMEALRIKKQDKLFFNMPFEMIALETGGSKLYSNTVALGSALGLLCFKIDPLITVLKSSFKKKGDEVVENNIKAAREGYSYAQDNFPGRCLFELKAIEKPSKQMLINGNEAIGLGALAAGLKFISAYPMTPSTGILTYIAGNARKMDVVVEQAEDEIAALNMVLGASYTGVRSMTTTSGGGFSLMVEALGLSGMTETPIVIALCQRPGPATGLPTMTEQGDLSFALHAAQGDFPRCILAPGTGEHAFYTTQRAFNIAEKFQIPVIILSDQYLADSLATYPPFDPLRIPVERHIMTEDEIPGHTYKRYLLTSSGISPRALPGQRGALVVADSDEHNEEGHINESFANRVSMMDKRMKKLDILKKEMMMPEIYGQVDAKTTLIGWGSTYGPLHEALHILKSDGVDVNLLHFTDIYPLPDKALDGAGDVKICVENNFSGQFARLLKAELGVPMDELILKYDGNPFTPEEIIRGLKEKGVV